MSLACRHATRGQRDLEASQTRKEGKAIFIGALPCTLCSKPDTLILEDFAAELAESVASKFPLKLVVSLQIRLP